MKDFENRDTNEQVETTEVPGEEVNVLTPGQKVVKEIVSWILCIAIALGVAFVLRTYIFTVVKVSGDSMLPTLENNQRLFVRIIGYEPARGDIVIFHPKSNPQTAYVKRVIATEGDRVWIDDADGSVHLKKKGSSEWVVLEENYIKNEAYVPGRPNMAQRYIGDDGEEGILIKENHVFVLGDNRNHSNDSRNEIGVGQVSEDSIIGKAVFRWWPLGDFGGLY